MARNNTILRFQWALAVRHQILDPTNTLPLRRAMPGPSHPTTRSKISFKLPLQIAMGRYKHALTHRLVRDLPQGVIPERHPQPCYDRPRRPIVRRSSRHCLAELGASLPTAFVWPLRPPLESVVDFAGRCLAGHQFRETSRLIVNSDRLSRRARRRVDSRLTKPRETHSRSAKINTLAHRVRSRSEFAPSCRTTVNSNDGRSDKASPNAASTSLFNHRRWSYCRSSGVNRRNLPEQMQPDLVMNIKPEDVANCPFEPDRTIHLASLHPLFYSPTES